jgi:hypothetical protein
LLPLPPAAPAASRCLPLLLLLPLPPAASRCSCCSCCSCCLLPLSPAPRPQVTPCRVSDCSWCVCAGLTYSYRMSNSLDSQRMSFALFKCADLLGAYTAARAIILGYATGEAAMSEVTLDGAKATVAYSIIARTSTRLSAAGAAWSSGYLGKGVDYSRWLLAQVDAVGVADALHSLKKYIVPLFDSGASNLAATCPTNKLEGNCDVFRAPHSFHCFRCLWCLRCFELSTSFSCACSGFEPLFVLTAQAVP